MILRKSLFALSGIILAGGVVVFGQQPQTQTTPDADLRKERIERMERRRARSGRPDGLRDHDRMGRRGGIGHFMRELDLTEAQRQQSRAIIERRMENTKAQRDELIKLREKRRTGTFAAEDEARARALRQEIREAMEGVRSEMAGILTAEQKAKLEQLKNERKAKIEQRMKERQELRKNNPE
ncbi:MAG: Spy/CpxP family protein refolding chaperone [Pyrinomonadaceae bacterium]